MLYKYKQLLEQFSLKYTIENPKGSTKVFVDDDDDSDYPLRKVKYPVDYGYIEGGYFAGDLAVQDFFLTAEALTANRFTTMRNNYTNGSFFTIT